MTYLISLACRWLVRIAGRLVPESQREQWEAEHAGEIWEFTLIAARRETPDSRFALIAHTRAALRSAFHARFRSEEAREHWQRVRGHPALCLGVVGLLTVALIIWSGGMPVLRAFTRGLPYRDPARIVILAQGPPFFGVRIGFREREMAVLRKSTKTLESFSSYTWGYTVFRSEGELRDVAAAEVSPAFFDVLGVAPFKGQGLGESEGFVASYEFWNEAMGGRESAIGQSFEIGGHALRLAGVMPRNFSFLSAPISVWVVAAPPALGQLLVQRGAVARLQPGVDLNKASVDLRQELLYAGVARRNFAIRVTPVADLVYRPLWSYASDFLTAIGFVLLWALFQGWRDRRRGAGWSTIRRFWGFFILKSVLAVVPLFIFVFEFTSAPQLGVTGGVRPGAGPLAAWLFYTGMAVILFWAWRDQPSRCRVCLERMRRPLRIGVPGQMLLETAGQEVMCPRGHGSVYTSDSVHGSELSDRWMGFP